MAREAEELTALVRAAVRQPGLTRMIAAEHADVAVAVLDRALSGKWIAQADMQKLLTWATAHTPPRGGMQYNDASREG